MSLFGFGKKKSLETKTPACTCHGACSVPETQNAEIVRDCCSEVTGSICCIKVLGSGCASCHTFYENVKNAVKEMGIAAEVQYITDLEKVMEYGVISMPALIVNDKIVSMGRVLKVGDIQKHLLTKI